MTVNDKNDYVCPFCTPKDLAIIFESNLFRAIYNKYPTVEGHSLIITKRHLESLTQLTLQEWIELREVTNKLLEALFTSFKSKSFDYAIQDGFAAGGSIDHFHIHVIPRKLGDLSSPEQWYPELLRKKFEPSERKKVELSMEAMRKIANEIKRHINNKE